MFLCSILTLRKNINNNYKAVYKEILGWWTAHRKSCSRTKQINAWAAKTYHPLYKTNNSTEMAGTTWHSWSMVLPPIIEQNRNVLLPSDNWIRTVPSTALFLEEYVMLILFCAIYFQLYSHWMWEERGVTRQHS